VALDGDLVYEALIPPQEELIEEIRRRYRKKTQRLDNKPERN
jgi:hypothetical protein